LPRQVGESLLALERTGAIQHRRRDVDTRDVAHDARERARQDAGAAGHVEHGVVGAGAAELDHEAERLLVLDARRGRERNGLTGELVEDQILMTGHRHSVSLYTRPPFMMSLMCSVA